MFETFVKSLKCEKDPGKLCPHKAGIQITETGVMKCSPSAYMGCCKCQELIKQMDKFEETL